MGLYKIKFCLVVIAFINAVTTRVFGDDRIPAKKRRSSDIREPRPYLSISLFYITFYIARVTVAVRNQKKKNVFERQEVHCYIHNFLSA